MLKAIVCYSFGYKLLIYAGTAIYAISSLSKIALDSHVSPVCVLLSSSVRDLRVIRWSIHR